MKPCLNAALALVVVSFAAPVLAQHDHGAMATVAVTKASVPATMTEGVVKRVDKTGARITITHGAIVNLDMPAMTMVFRVKDAAWLDRVKEGDKIRFAAESPNGVLTVVALDAVK